MVTPTTQKVLIAGVAILIIAFIGYRLFIKAPDAPADGVTLAVEDTEGQDILNLVDRLNKTTINKEVFSSSLFTNLVDLTANLAPESQGRPNPFAAIGSDQNNTTVTQTNRKTN